MGWLTTLLVNLSSAILRRLTNSVVWLEASSTLAAAAAEEAAAADATPPLVSPAPPNLALVVPTRFFSGAGGMILPTWEWRSTNFSWRPRKSENRRDTVVVMGGEARLR